ncbi:nitronate monooxygenase [Austwickia sp. TVS 96-490-7B]|uniref:nitronate monooxygenase n=1 Tax=Austwickia sp. TVS 96-490-7B TaxID=2830843 RepID=UPI001C573F52|nr:nitronate monooxygenase [Austwickia sp. TVS 96-490-7B]
MASRLDVSALPVPVIAAPMAGGPSTVELVTAVGAAGGLGFVAGGYRSAAEMVAQIEAVRQHRDLRFGVNVFVPGSGEPSPELRRHVCAYRGALALDGQRYAVEVPQPRWRDDDDWLEKIAALTSSAPVPVVSFTFGTPGVAVVSALHEVGSAVWVTVTCREEAVAAVAEGVDALVVQGFDAGGHRGTHQVGDEPNALDHLALVPMMSDLGVPLIAAGGVTTAGDVRRALQAGAVAVQVGTALLLTPEAGTSAGHRLALTDPVLSSTVTRAFTGRVARGLRNRFVVEHDEQAPAAFPAVDGLTRPLRAAAAACADLGGLALWAGSGWRAAAEEPAAEVICRLGEGAIPTDPR